VAAESDIAAMTGHVLALEPTWRVRGSAGCGTGH
jgi:hypothetical protein